MAPDPPIDQFEDLQEWATSEAKRILSGESCSLGQISATRLGALCREIALHTEANADGSSQKPTIILFPLARVVGVRFREFRNAAATLPRSLPKKTLELVEKRAHVGFAGWERDDVTSSVTGMMFKDLRRWPVLVAVLLIGFLSALATLPSTGRTNILLLSDATTAISSIFLAVFAFYSGNAQKIASQHRRLIGKHYDEDRVLLRWTIVALLASLFAKAGYFASETVQEVTALISAKQEYSDCADGISTTLALIAGFLVVLSSMSVISPIYDVSNFLLGRNLSLTSSAAMKEILDKWDEIFPPPRATRIPTSEPPTGESPTGEPPTGEPPA